MVNTEDLTQKGKKVTLERVYFYATHVLVPKVLEEVEKYLINPAVEAKAPMTVRNVILSLTGFLWGEPAGEETVSYPENWW